MTSLSTEDVEDNERVAFVVMQFASTPWDLFDIAARALQTRGYLTLRADQVDPGSDQLQKAEHVWRLIKHADFVLVDITNWNVNVYIELGVAAAWAQSGERGKPRIGVIGAKTTTLPFDVREIQVHRYSLGGQRSNTLRSIRKAVLEAESAATMQAIRPPPDSLLGLRLKPGTRAGEATKAGREILDWLPEAVTRELQDPAAALLATRYLQYLGKLIGEELAGMVGFPGLPAKYLKLGEGPGLDLPAHLREHAEFALGQLWEVVRERDRRVAEALDVARFSETDRRLVFTQALQRDKKSLSSAESEVLSSTLGNIAGTAAGTNLRHTILPHSFEQGLSAVARLTRLRSLAVAPNTVGTLGKVVGPADESGKGSLRAISTLGGALFLGHHIGLLRDAESPYAGPALRLAKTALEGQKVKVRREGDVQVYRDGLTRLADQHDFVFTVEHPFHFRVLLELISDENRRYATESILNYAALKELWGEPGLWNRFVWFRDELPVVSNLAAPGDTVTDFEQHYVGFGRTPHTSSFMRMTYEANTPLSPQEWWPAELCQNSQSVVRNLPNSVALAEAGVSRQRMLGRLWRGADSEADLVAASAEVAAWDRRADAASIASALWDVQQWPGLGFPALAIAELQCAVWILEAVSSRRARKKDRGMTPEARKVARVVAKQTDYVLQILRLYLDDYLKEEGDGPSGLLRTLAALDRFADGARMRTNLPCLVDRVRDLVASLREFAGA